MDELELDDENRTLTFQIDSIQYEYDIYRKTLRRGDTIPEEEKNNWASYAPDSSYMVFAKNHNTITTMTTGYPLLSRSETYK